MLGGYMGKILRVDLSTQEILTETFQEEILRKYLGGSGLGAKILLEETTEKTDPLGPDNILIFMTGPLVGTRALNFGRHQVVTKSPLTGIYGEANSGGTWGVHLKRAGYDGLIISGRSSKPVYLWLNNDIVQIRDASSIWGKDTFETDLLLKRELGSDIVTCSIGQAGENLVKIAAIMNDGIHGRAAARCGVGAVMGSKKLKAIAVKGDLKPYTVNEKALKKSIRNWSPKIRENTLEMNKFGTSEM
ncbi:MAG: aldehyde:ferredoxin oxidoreductase, partial [Clostridia bacterium]|nr:aldehyde:ferredoxin oxidoreductase [Clostridia bacterium]